MEKKLITEMKFMMERLENPRMTYTEYEKKHKLLTEDSDFHHAHVKTFHTKDKPVSKKKKFIDEACLTISKDMIITTGNVFDVTIKCKSNFDSDTLEGIFTKSDMSGVFTMDIDNKTVKTKNGPNVTFDELVTALKQYKLDPVGGETNAYDRLIKLIELGWGTTKF